MENSNDRKMRGKIPRRDLLKTLGLGLVLGGTAGSSALSGEEEMRRHFQAQWTHASALQVEYPERMEYISRKPFHTRVQGKPGTTNRILFAIPTPVVGTWPDKQGKGVYKALRLRYRRYKVDKIFVHFRSASVHAKVTGIELHDGQKKTAEFHHLNLFGENPFKDFDLPDNPEVQQGLCLSVEVEFGQKLRWMEFHSAGADFYIIS